jgi:hypothetical protein
MLPTISLLGRNLRNVTCGGEDEVRMLNAVLPPVRHADNEWLKRHRSKQLPNAGFHCPKIPLDGSFGNHACATPNDLNIGHPKLFMAAEEGSGFLAAASGE